MNDVFICIYNSYIIDIFIIKHYEYEDIIHMSNGFI